MIKLKMQNSDPGTVYMNTESIDAVYEYPGANGIATVILLRSGEEIWVSNSMEEVISHCK